MSATRRLGHLNPYDLHKRLINDYLLKRAGDTRLLQPSARDTRHDRTDADVLRDNHRFLWTAADDEAAAAAAACQTDATTTTASDAWEQRLARKYYDKLFKEYCICDLSRYRENRVALRWRTEPEVIAGRGQFSCAAKGCSVRDGGGGDPNDDECKGAGVLRSWEVNFAYAERGERRNALVKVRLCPACSARLNYRSQRREVKRVRRAERERAKSARRRSRRAGDGDSGDRLLTAAEIKRSESSARTDVDDDDAAKQAAADDSKNSTNGGGAVSATKTEEGDCWSRSAAGAAEAERSREEEFDEYLEDLLL